MSQENSEHSGGNGPLILIVIILLGLVGALIMWGIHNAPEVKKEQKHLKEIRLNEVHSQIYQEAYGLMREYNFEEALVLLYRLPTFYKDSDSLKAYCRSRMAYEEGNLREAYQQIKSYPKMIGVYIAPDAKEYQASMLEQKALLEKQEEENFFKELKNKLPYKGMDEAYMHQTKLGKAVVTENSGKCKIDGQIYPANRYSYYEKDKLVYAAICANGKVLYVEDHFGKEINFVSSKKKDTSIDYDPLDAASYSNEEDFYDDNYDYFSDYYEAEEYYFEHQ